MLKPQNSLRKEHEDVHFCAAAVKHLKELCELMGKDAVFAMSQDDNAQVPLGKTACKVQQKVVMSMKFLKLAQDHDYVAGPGHNMVPSVYAGLEFKDKKLSYSGPTYIAVRSGKHVGSSAETLRS
jgi:hypothetical protein